MTRVLVGAAIVGALISAVALTRPAIFGLGERPVTAAVTPVVSTSVRDRTPRGRQGFGGFGGGPDLQIVKQFDQNGDNRLNADERRAARTYLQSQGRPSPGGRGYRFGGGRSPAERGPRLTPADVKSYPDAPLYDAGTLRTIFLQFDADDWEDELADFYHTDVEVPATIVVDGKSYRDVGVHFRGNSSYRQVPLGRKHSLSISVDFVHDGQHLYGYRTVHLLNANDDPTFLKPILYGEIARDYIAAPKTNYMRVVINGESWGVYPNVQSFNKDFLRDNFGTTDGVRWNVPGSPRGRGGLEYLGDDASAYRWIFELKSKDDPKSWSHLIRLCEVLNTTPAAKLEAALAPILDIDGALRFLALDNALINNDGYWTRASDYSLFEDRAGRFHVIPHDFNETVNETEGRGFSGAAAHSVELDPLIGLDDPSKPLRSRLLAVPALRAKYLAYVRDVAEKWLDWTKLGPIAQRYQALIRADVRTDTHRLYGFEEFDANGMTRPFAEGRRAFLLAYTER